MFYLQTEFQNVQFPENKRSSVWINWFSYLSDVIYNSIDCFSLKVDISTNRLKEED